jgi:hypothetical protein
MPTYLVVILVSLAVAVLAVMLNMASRPRRALLDEESARQAWLDAAAGETIREVVLSRDRHAALILSDEGPALVWTSGRQVIVRRLLDFDVLDEGGTLRIVFRDFDTPEALLKLDDFERPRWLNLLDAG